MIFSNSKLKLTNEEFVEVATAINQAWEGDKIFFRLLNEERPYFSLKLVYEGDTLTQAVLDGKRIV